MGKTVEEWNAENPCCCPLPLCPIPVQECSSITALGAVCGASDFGYWNTYGGWDEPPCSSSGYTYSTITRTVNASRTGGDGLTYHSVTVSSYARDEDGIVCEFSTDTETTGTFPGEFGFELNPTRNQGATAEGYFFEYGESGENSLGWVRTLTDRLEYSGRIDNRPHIISQMAAIIAKALAEPTWEPGSSTMIRGSACAAETVTLTTTDCPGIDPALPRTMRQTRVSVQWVVPSEVEGEPFLGEWFKVTFDVVFFPETGDPEVIALDVTREWTGPGSGEPDDASWKIGLPYVLETPDEDGEVRIVNVRFACYRSPVGPVVQVTGEAYEIPE
jgi:hypothetical protein